MSNEGHMVNSGMKGRNYIIILSKIKIPSESVKIMWKYNGTVMNHFVQI